MLDWFSKKLGIYHLLPRGAVIGPWHRSQRWPGEEPSGVGYEQAPQLPFPILPVLPFGLTYELDLVIVSEHPGWNMHEYALVRTPEGARWLAKDAREHSLAQSIVADIEGLDTWLPEIPIERRRSELLIEDRSTLSDVDLSIAYTNLDGEPVEVHYQGPAPFSAERQRNGSTMGHSRDHLLAVLDLSHKDHGRRSSIRIDNVEYKTSRILRLVPFRFAVQQTQGGLCVGRFRQDRHADGFQTVHSSAAGEIAQRWTLEEPERGVVEAWQRTPLRSLRYRFLKVGERLELCAVSVFQWGRGAPCVHIAFHPALPDLRCGFEGKAASRFVIDVNGQQNHCVGAAVARHGEEGARLELRPRAPWWTADRPMDTRAHVHGDHAHVEIERVAASVAETLI